uniref:Secreted protein n=1 Tax=Photinus pyralis TaxID=7054 RepID=A0A1Y1K240_PHOPY
MLLETVVALLQIFLQIAAHPQHLNTNTIIPKNDTAGRSWSTGGMPFSVLYMNSQSLKYAPADISHVPPPVYLRRRELPKIHKNKRRYPTLPHLFATYERKQFKQ